MRYHGDELTRLFDEIVRQGGALLPDPCMPQDRKYSDGVHKRITQGCGQDTMFVHVYDPESEAQVKRGAGFVRACARCDDVGQWPRYRAALGDDDADTG